jgi:hypothetical protein
MSNHCAARVDAAHLNLVFGPDQGNREIDLVKEGFGVIELRQKETRERLVKI